MSTNNITWVFCLTAFLGLFRISSAASAPLELEQILALKNPICIDMRIQTERQRASASIKTNSLHAKFNCRKTYVLPLSVKPTEGMLERYVAKINKMSGHVVLAWCSQGQRSQIIAERLDPAKVRYYQLRGGTSYFKQVLELQSE